MDDGTVTSHCTYNCMLDFVGKSAYSKSMLACCSAVKRTLCRGACYTPMYIWVLNIEADRQVKDIVV